MLFGWGVRESAPVVVLRLAAGDAESDSDTDSSDGEGGAGGGSASTVGAVAVQVEAAAVVELESCKLQAMADAVELASALVGIDMIIVDTR